MFVSLLDKKDYYVQWDIKSHLSDFFFKKKSNYINSLSGNCKRIKHCLLHKNTTSAPYKSGSSRVQAGSCKTLNTTIQ